MKDITQEILKDKGCFEQTSNKSFVITEHDSMWYSKCLLCDYSQLKNLINNDNLLAQTLLNLIINHCKALWGNIAYKINYADNIITFEITHTDKKIVGDFKICIIQYCEFAFSDAYLSPTRLEQLSIRDRGTRIEYESKPDIVDNFNKELKTWLLMDKLDNLIPDKKDKINKDKGKI